MSNEKSDRCGFSGETTIHGHPVFALSSRASGGVAVVRNQRTRSYVDRLEGRTMLHGAAAAGEPAGDAEVVLIGTAADVLRVNVGGPEMATAAGLTFAADAGF